MCSEFERGNEVNEVSFQVVLTCTWIIYYVQTNNSMQLCRYNLYIHKVTVDCGHPSGLRVRQKDQCYINAITVQEENNYSKIGLLDWCLRAPNYSTHLN